MATRPHLRSWIIVCIIACLLLILPFLALGIESVSELFASVDSIADTTSHFVEYLLLDYAVDTSLLLLLTLFFGLLFSLPSAYILASRRIRGGGLMYWLNILPLTIPTYIASYIWAEVFAYPNAGYSLLHGITGYSSIYSVLPLAIIFASVLYPYIFVQAYQAFRSRILALQGVSDSLGVSSLRYYLRSGASLLLFPVSYGGMLLALETLNDYGAVKLYGVNTFTSGIFKAWYGMGDLGSALILSMSLLISVMGIRLLVSSFRVKGEELSGDEYMAKKERGGKGMLYLGAAGLVPMIFFIFPIVYMIGTSVSVGIGDFDTGVYLESIGNSALFASTGSIMAVFLSLIVSYVVYHRESRLLSSIVTISVSGYSVPGAVTALGAVMLGGWLDWGVGLPYIVLLYWAYMSRYIMIAHAPIATGMEGEFGKYSKVSMSLGKGMWGSLYGAVVPAAVTVLVSSLMMVGVEIMKDLPLTLILRDYGTETLSTSAYRYANDEQLVRSFPYGLSMISISVIALLLTKKISRKKH